VTALLQPIVASSFVLPERERHIAVTVQQRSGNSVHAQCTDVFHAVLTRSGDAVLHVRYELNLKHFGEFQTVRPLRTLDSMRRNRKTKKKTDLQFTSA
jgi:hypothetical protein